MHKNGVLKQIEKEQCSFNLSAVFQKLLEPIYL